MSNNEEQTTDEKLRASANKAYKNHFEACEDQSFAFSKTEWIDGYMHAAREYWQAQQKKIDVDKLALDIFLLIPVRCPDNKECMNVAKRIINTLLPHLQPESDAKKTAIDVFKYLSEYNINIHFIGGGEASFNELADKYIAEYEGKGGGNG